MVNDELGRLGVVTRNCGVCGDFDIGFFEAKDVIGRREQPSSDCHNMVSVHGDNKAVEETPKLAPVNSEGERATRENEKFDWDYVCPTSEYTDEMLSLIDEYSSEGNGIRLDTLGFPREGFCRCERCENAFEEFSGDTFEEANSEDEYGSEKEWLEWRASVVTEFLEDAARRVDTPLSLTLYPDPFPSHQYERFGLDVSRASDIVDFFVVPIYETHYDTTHWLETLALGFEDNLDKPFYVELYAPNIEMENLVKAARVALEHADGVLFAYDDESASEAKRKLESNR